MGFLNTEKSGQLKNMIHFVLTGWQNVLMTLLISSQSCSCSSRNRWEEESWWSNRRPSAPFKNLKSLIENEPVHIVQLSSAELNQSHLLSQLHSTTDTDQEVRGWIICDVLVWISITSRVPVLCQRSCLAFGEQLAWLSHPQQWNQQIANHHRVPAPAHSAGKKVWLSSCDLPLQVKPNSLTPSFIHPFETEKIISPTAVRLPFYCSLQVHHTFHVLLIKPGVTSDPAYWWPSCPLSQRDFGHGASGISIKMILNSSCNRSQNLDMGQ